MNIRFLATFVLGCCAACASDDDSSSTIGRVSDTSETDGPASGSGPASDGQSSSESGSPTADGSDGQTSDGSSGGQVSDGQEPDTADPDPDGGDKVDPTGSGDCVTDCVADWTLCDAVEHEVVEDCQLLCEQLIPGFQQIPGCLDAWMSYEECVTSLTCDEYEEFSAGEGSYPCLGEEQTYGAICFLHATRRDATVQMTTT